jgi:hypothetical protein
MKTQSVDTTAEAERVQIELFRKAGSARRFGLMRSLSQTTMKLSRRAIRRRYPHTSDQEIKLIFVSLHYGQDLKDQLVADLQRRTQ